MSIGNQICACTLLTWDLDGEHVAGEDQDVWLVMNVLRQMAAGGELPADAAVKLAATNPMIRRVVALLDHGP